LTAKWTAKVRSRVEAYRYHLAWRSERHLASASYYPYSEEILAGGLVALAATAAAYLWNPLTAPRWFWQLALFLAGMTCLLGIRRLTQRWILREEFQGPDEKITKSNVDGFLQLSYLLTTAGGFGLVAAGNVGTSLLMLVNAGAGILIFDAARPLRARESVENDVSYVTVNGRHMRALRKLLRVQIGFTALALLWSLTTTILGG
jgi:hypothetical protein